MHPSWNPLLSFASYRQPEISEPLGSKYLKIGMSLAFTLDALGWLAKLLREPAGFLRRDPLHSELFLIQLNHPLCSIWLLML